VNLIPQEEMQIVRIEAVEVKVLPRRFRRSHL
jgi:hypothetical protein